MTIFYDSLSQPVPLPANEPVKWRLSAYAFVKSSDEKILMIKSLDSGRWELPGGKVEIGERLRDAVAREVYEETGYKITVEASDPRFIGECSWYKQKSSEFFQCVFFIFAGTLLSDVQDAHVINTIGPLETEEVAWVDPATLSPKNCHPNFYPFLSSLSV